MRIRLATISQRQRQPLNTYTPTHTRTHRQADTAMYNPEIKHIKIKILSGGSSKERKRNGGGKPGRLLQEISKIGNLY